MKNHKALLVKLLKTLVEEWGYEEVTSALASTAATSIDPLAEVSVRRSKKRARLSAAEQIEQSGLQGGQKEALLQLARRYDRKMFLPSVADVREFLIMLGERPIGMKDRTGAFRVLLRTLAQLPVERLQRLTHTALHSGPSELGPLSDAIAAAGERLPRHRQAD